MSTINAVTGFVLFYALQDGPCISMMDLVPHKQVACILGEDVDGASALGCIADHIAQAALKNEEIAANHTVKVNRTLTLLCSPRNTSIEYWSEHGQDYGNFSAQRAPKDDQFVNGTARFENVVTWTKNGITVDFTNGPEACLAADISAACQMYPSTEGHMVLHHAQSGSAGIYACIVTDGCRLLRSSGTCRSRLGQLFRVIFDHTNSNYSPHWSSTTSTTSPGYPTGSDTISNSTDLVIGISHPVSILEANSNNSTNNSTNNENIPGLKSGIEREDSIYHLQDPHLNVSLEQTTVMHLENTAKLSLPAVLSSFGFAAALFIIFTGLTDLCFV